ncbi:hypothetical protein [Mycolicibacterium boenickei]|nr:hypothetical protein [Mycolicibacterium boenickei]
MKVGYPGSPGAETRAQVCMRVAWPRLLGVSRAGTVYESARL